MNFRKLLTYFAFGTAAVMPFAGAQNPTILQGNYITNVFGNSNFVLNPNAQTNVLNVTNATRVITTPLVATSGFTLNLTNGQNADWTLRTFDSGMKGQNCEARFTYRGFATATTTAQIIQGASTVVAQLVLTPTTDPRIASINFPCGDLSQATKFRIAQTTANMTTVTPNEIGGIYVGLATNMANVAQAELVVSANRSTTQSIPNITNTTVIFATENNDVYGEYDPTTGIFTAKRAGEYFVQSMILYTNAAWTAGNSIDLNVLRDSSVICSQNYRIQYTGSTYHGNQVSCHLTMSIGQQIKLQTYQDRGSATDLLGTGAIFYNRLQIYRFPSSSELVVKPETQNVWAMKRLTTTTASTTAAAFTQLTGTTGTATYFGKAVDDGSTNRDWKVTVNNIPPGSYKVTLNAFLAARQSSSSTDRTACYFQITDGTTNNQTFIDAHDNGSTASAYATSAGMSAVFTYTGVQSSITFAVKGYRNIGAGSCEASSLGDNAALIVQPLDQPSNSALYVQGPVQAAATGAAIPSGYQGETYANNSSVDNFAGLATYASLTLNPGVWTIFAKASAIDSAGTSGVTVDGACIITTNSAADPTSYYTAWVNQGDYFGFGGTSASSGSTALRQGNGSNMTVFALTSQQTVYLRCRLTYGSGTYAGRGSLRAVRIN